MTEYRNPCCFGSPDSNLPPFKEFTPQMARIYAAQLEAAIPRVKLDIDFINGCRGVSPETLRIYINI